MAKTVFQENDYKANKGVGSVGYLLFFVPLIACPGSEYGRFCANQGLLFLLAELALSLLSSIFSGIPILGIVMNVAFWVAQVGLLLLTVFYMLRAMNGDVRELPYIGHYRLFR